MNRRVIVVLAVVLAVVLWVWRHEDPMTTRYGRG
jgi:hypothetical protein